jgi:hypothetical protein
MNSRRLILSARMTASRRSMRPRPGVAIALTLWAGILHRAVARRDALLGWPVPIHRVARSGAAILAKNSCARLVPLGKSEFGTELPVRDVRCHGEYWGRADQPRRSRKPTLRCMSQKFGNSRHFRRWIPRVNEFRVATQAEQPPQGFSLQ